MTGLAILLIAMTCSLLWIGIVAPAILRALGVPVSFGVWRIDRLNQHLSRTQYVWALGMFVWGLGLFWFFTVFDLVTWKLLGAFQSSPMRIIKELLICLAAGWLFGVFSGPHRKDADRTFR